VLFASTHQDEQAVAKQKEEKSRLRESVNKRVTVGITIRTTTLRRQPRSNRDGTTDGLTRLTNAKFTDAEGNTAHGTQIRVRIERESVLADMSPSSRERFDTRSGVHGRFVFDERGRFAN